MKTLFAWTILAFPLLGMADTVVPIESVKYFVNIRKSPETGAEVVGRLERGASLPLVASNPKWNEVRLDSGDTGFISADWTDVITEAAEIVADGEPLHESERIEEPQPIARLSEDIEEPEQVAEEPEVVEEPQPVVEAVEQEPMHWDDETEAAAVVTVGETGPQGLPGYVGPPGPQGPAGPPGAATIKGDVGYLVKFKEQTVGNSSQIYDNGNQVGIGTTEPKQRLEVNGNIQIHEQNSGVAGLMITQSSGDTGYIMHNRANTLTIGAGSVDRVTIDRDGNIGIGVAKPAHPIDMANGAHVTAGGVWTNSSSRARKENIGALSTEDALATLARLQPVHFNYKNDRRESHLGFIAEDVPELVASTDRQGLSAMDIVAVLTRVIQAQQQRIEALEARITSGEQHAQ